MTVKLVKTPDGKILAVREPGEPPLGRKNRTRMQKQMDDTYFKFLSTEPETAKKMYEQMYLANGELIK
jgi:hypothetical protein